MSARLTVGAVVLLGLGVLAEAARGLDRAFVGQPHLELFTVMVGIPMTLNVGQAWIQDQVGLELSGAGGGGGAGWSGVDRGGAGMGVEGCVVVGVACGLPL